MRSLRSLRRCASVNRTFQVSGVQVSANTRKKLNQMLQTHYEYTVDRGKKYIRITLVKAWLLQELHVP